MMSAVICEHGRQLTICAVCAPEAEKRLKEAILLHPERIEVANRLRCSDCGHAEFLIDTTGSEGPTGIINLVECARCHATFVMTVEVG